MSKTQGRVCVCSDSSGPYAAIGKSYLEGLGTMKAKGVSSNYITEITKDNISYCKQLVDLTNELRHLDGIKGNFAVSQSEYLAVNHLQKNGSEPELIYTDVKEMVEAQQFLFDNLWNRGITAEQKIKQIEEGVEPEFLEVSGRSEAATIVARLAQSVQKEALFLLPNDKAMMRVDKAGVLDSLIAASTRGVSVRIICPITDRNLGIVKRIAENAPLLQVHNGKGLPYGFIIADNEKYFSAAGGMEEPEAENISEAIGFGLYSNSRASIDSFRSFFELIWNKPYEDPSLTEDEVKIYLEQVINEVSRARHAITGRTP
jgi:hypothetical protein